MSDRADPKRGLLLSKTIDEVAVNDASITNVYPVTPDGRYFVVRGRLWRKTNPSLPEAKRKKLVSDLSKARVALRRNGKASAEERQQARRKVDAAKRGLGERGPVWWTDGAPDYNRHMAVNTPYREWFEGLP